MTDVPPIPGETAHRTYPPRARRWLPAAAVAVGLLYALAVNGQWAIRADSARVMTLGRSLAEGRGLEYNGVPAPGAAPLVPAVIAGCRLLAGPHALWLINALVSLCGVGTALAALGIVNRMVWGRRTKAARVPLAVGTFLVVGVSARLFGDATVASADVPMAFLAALGVYAFVRSRDGHWAWCLLGAAAFAAAAGARWDALVLYPPVAAAVLLDRGAPGRSKRLLGTLVASAVVAGVVGLWFYGTGGRWPAEGVAGPQLVLPWQTADAAEGWARLVADLARAPLAVAEVLTDQELAGANVVLAGLALVGLAVAVWRRWWLVALPVVAYAAWLAARGGVLTARSLLPLLPLVACCLLAGTWWTAAATVGWVRSGRVRRAVPRMATLVVIVICLAISVPKDLRAVAWARHGDFYRAYAHGKWRGVVEVSQALARRGRPGTDAVATPDPAVVHYLTRLTVVTGPLGTHEGRPFGLWDPEGVPPAEFAEAAAAGRFRFLVVPADEPAWTPMVLEALAGTRAFTRPETFVDVALLERLPPASAAETRKMIDMPPAPSGR